MHKMAAMDTGYTWKGKEPALNTPLEALTEQRSFQDWDSLDLTVLTENVKFRLVHT